MLIVVGYGIIAIASFLTPEEGKGIGSTILGVTMIFFSLIVQATQFVVEEKICAKYQISPERMVGMEGQFGLVFIITWAVVASFVNCPSADMCNIYGT